MTGCVVGVVWDFFCFSLCAVRQVGGEKERERERGWEKEGDVEVWENGETLCCWYEWVNVWMAQVRCLCACACVPVCGEY